MWLSHSLFIPSAVEGHHGCLQINALLSKIAFLPVLFLSLTAVSGGWLRAACLFFLPFVGKLSYGWGSFSFSRAVLAVFSSSFLLSGTAWVKRPPRDTLGPLPAPQTTSLHPHTFQSVLENGVNLLLQYSWKEIWELLILPLTFWI